MFSRSSQIRSRSLIDLFQEIYTPFLKKSMPGRKKISFTYDHPAPPVNLCHFGLRSPNFIIHKRSSAVIRGMACIPVYQNHLTRPLGDQCFLDPCAVSPFTNMSVKGTQIG